MLAALAFFAFSTATQANERAWLGIWMGAEPKHLSDIARSQRQIVSIVTIERGSPAEAAGLILFDVIFEIDGQPIQSRRAVLCLIQVARPGQTLLLAIQRQQEARTILVTLAEWPKDGIAPSNLDCPPVETSLSAGGRAKTVHMSSPHLPLTKVLGVDTWATATKHFTA
jgi:hypothetical protein